MSHHENASMINHEESSSSSSKSPVPTAKSDELKIARDEFIHTVARTIQRIKEENGYNCDRATNLILRELTASTTTTNHHGWEDELNYVKQRYHLTHQQASRAYAVSLAIKKLVQEDGKLSVLESVRYLTEKLANATFVRTTEGSEPRCFSSASESSSTCQILTTTSTTTPTTTTTPAAGIRLPEMPKQQPQSTLPERRSTKSPAKRSKSSSSASKATNTKGKQSLTAKSTRKRSLEEMASTGSSSTQPSSSSDKNSGSSSDSSRHRSDSVTEAVSAKMMQNNNNDPSSSVVNSEKQTTARTKRRSTGSLDEAEAGPVNKRGRTTSTA